MGASFALFCQANGFDPDDATELDSISSAIVLKVSQWYRELKGMRCEVVVVIPYYLNRSEEGIRLFDVLRTSVLAQGIAPRDLVWEDSLPSINAITDGETLVSFHKTKPEFQIKVFAPSVVARYFNLTYRAVFIRAGVNPCYELITVRISANRASRLVYAGLAWVVRLMPNSWFPFWARLRTLTDKSRVNRFTRTIQGP